MPTKTVPWPAYVSIAMAPRFGVGKGQTSIESCPEKAEEKTADWHPFKPPSIYTAGPENKWDLDTWPTKWPNVDDGFDSQATLAKVSRAVLSRDGGCG